MKPFSCVECLEFLCVALQVLSCWPAIPLQAQGILFYRPWHQTGRRGMDWDSPSPGNSLFPHQLLEAASHSFKTPVSTKGFFDGGESSFLRRALNVLPKQSHRWQYVVFTELFPQVNLLILAESDRISFSCSYNALRMRTPKSMEKARKASLPEHWQTELEMQNPSVLHSILYPLSQGWYLRSWTRKQFSILEKSWRSLKWLSQKPEMSSKFWVHFHKPAVERVNVNLIQARQKMLLWFQLIFPLCFWFTITRLASKNK